MSGLRPGDTELAGVPPDDPSWYERRALSFLASYEAFDPNGRGAPKYPTEDERKRIVAHLASVLREVREAGVRPSDTEADPAIAAWAAGETREIVVQLAKDIISAIESHDTHRMKHIEQYARRIVRVAGGK